MQMAMIGLGRMGGNMVERLMRNGHQTVVYDRSSDVVAKYQKMGSTPAKDLGEVVAKLTLPRVVWIMVHGLSSAKKYQASPSRSDWKIRDSNKRSSGVMSVSGMDC